LDETDLSRLASEYGIAQTPEQLPTREAYMLLALEAERFVLVQAPKYGRPVESVKAQIRSNREQFASVLAAVTGLSVAECMKRVMPETPQ
jgi:hypothetical protein